MKRLLDLAVTRLAAWLVVAVASAASICALPAFAEATPCPNEVFRSGPSAKLPDCRAYELVTPSDTAGLEPDFGNYIGNLSNAFNTSLITPDGNSTLFHTIGAALTGTPGNGYVNRYRAVRTANGWTTALVGIPGDQAISTEPGGSSPDQGFYFVDTKNLLSVWAPWQGMIEATLLATPDGFEPAGRGSLGDDPEADGKFISEDGTHIVFTSTAHLEPNAPPAGVQAVYDRAYGGETHVISLLPGDVIPTQPSSYIAASKDGSEVVFESGPSGGTGEGSAPLYLRRADGTTVALPAPAGYTFAGIMGGHVFFTDRHTSGFVQTPADLYSYDIATGTTTAITEGTESSSFVNVSEDGSRVFFTSLAALTGSEENEYGQSAVPAAKGSGTLAHAKGTATLSTASGEGQVTKGSTEVSDVSTKTGSFEVGMEISGDGILTETTITAVGGGTLTLSKPGTLTTKTELHAGSKTATGVSASEGAFEVGMEITNGVFPGGTTITAVGAGTVTLSKGATSSGVSPLEAGSKTITGLSTSEGQFLAGMMISGTGIRASTTITAVGAGTLTLSQAVTTSGVQSLTGGSPNLYVWSRSDESTKFIATVAPEDVTSFQANREANLTTWFRAIGSHIKEDTGRAGNHTRSTPDGSVLAFESTASLTGFDNAEASPEDCGRSSDGRQIVAGQACDEVFRYETDTGELHCVSCGGGSGPATGEARLQSVKSRFGPVTPLSAYTPVESLTEDGNMLFFESTESLLPRDTNGTKDVYEWETGKGLSLVSTGQDEGESALWAVTPSGSDVLFATREKLLPQDENGSSVRIYDARANGGFPPPESTVTEPCTGDACQGAPSAAPTAPETASGSLQAEGGNLPQKLSCAKSKRRVVRRGKEQCVKKQHRRHRHHKRGANR